MRRALLGLAAFASLTVLGGCAFTAPVVPPSGWIYSSYKAPIDIDAQSTNVSEKSGSSSSKSYVGLVALGDASVTTAARNGGLKTIDHVDYSYTNILFFYQKFETTVYGE